MALAKDADVRAQDRKRDRARNDRTRSVQAAQAAFTDSAGTQFIEPWADLTNWIVRPSAGLIVNAGDLTTDTTGGANGALHRGVALNAKETMRIVTSFYQPVVSNTSCSIIVGFDDQAVGGTPIGGGGGGGINVRGIQINAATGVVNKWDAGTTTTLTGTTTETGRYPITIVADETYVTFTMRSPSGTKEWRARWLRTAIVLSNFYILNTDAQTTLASRRAVGPVAIRRALATSVPRIAEGNGSSVHWGAAAGISFRIAFPASYDSRVPCPAAILFHGNGSDETHFADNGNGYPVANALLAAGYIVASVAWTGGNAATWGSDNGVNTYRALYQYLIDHYAIGTVVLYGNSMGGMDMLNCLARESIPGVAAIALSVPAVNLAANYANATFTSIIDIAYGITGDYAAKTAGHDPALMDPRVFGSLPVLAIIATDDTVVLPAQNWNLIEPGIQATSPDYQRINGTGGHSMATIGASAAAIVNFFKPYR